MPIVLTLPDGATREVEPGTLARDVVASIGSRLLRDAIAVSIDGEVQDLMTPIRRGGAFTVITERDPRSLAVLRHSGAHILATAVRRLRPDAKIGFGPAIEDGFYYDFEVPEPFANWTWRSSCSSNCRRPTMCRPARWRACGKRSERNGVRYSARRPSE